MKLNISPISIAISVTCTIFNIRCGNLCMLA